MKFTFVLQLDPYKVTSTEVEGQTVLNADGNEMYRTVDWATVPERGDRIMIDNDQVPERFAMVGFWCEVDSRSYRRDGILLVNLSPAWPREKPLPEEDGWTDVAPWMPEVASGKPEVDGGWYLYPKGSNRERAGTVAERWRSGPHGIEVLGLSRTRTPFTPGEYTASGWWWWVTNGQKIIGYRPFVRGEVPPLDWADKCLAGLTYRLNPNGEPTFFWAAGARLTDGQKV